MKLPTSIIIEIEFQITNPLNKYKKIPLIFLVDFYFYFFVKSSVKTSLLVLFGIVIFSNCDIVGAI
jgi:hypothetical protein